MKLLVGLGNPGKEYENTRHNIGFMVLNYFPGNNLWKEKFNGLYCEQNFNGEKVVFVKPLTYMNLSGDCVVRFVNYYDIRNEDILIIQDDLDLDYLKYRLKFDSSAGGHNGIKSIINNLHTQPIPRLKIGIAHNKNIDTRDYVLGKLSKEDMDILSDTYNKVSNIVQDFINNDINTLKQIYSNKNN